MADLNVLAIHGCCMGDLPAEKVSGGLRRSTTNALKAAGFDDVEVKAPFYGSLLFSYARGEIERFAEHIGVGSIEESIGGGKHELAATYTTLSEELEMEMMAEFRLPIPNFVREWALHAFMTDVSTYLAMDSAKRAIWGVISHAWDEFGESGPDLVISHSLGTVVAWDFIASQGTTMSKPKGLLMMGSPLYLGAVRTKISADIDTDLGVEPWIHIFDDGDIVAGGRGIAGHFTRARDVQVENPAFPTSHDYPGYIHAAASGGLVDQLLM